MSESVLEKILSDLLKYYLGLDESSLEKHLKESNLANKERIATLKDLQVIIYSNDHNPPHFHVMSKDRAINAKFTIEKCELMTGAINSRDLRRIKAFYDSPKGKIILRTIWNKKYNQ